MSHYGLPWPLVRWAIRNFRKHFFTIEQPEVRHLTVSVPVDEIRVLLGKSHFTPGWKFSYHYFSEDLNMRRPEYNEADLERPWYQTHVRGFELPNGDVKLIAHYEYCPLNYPEPHLHNENLSIGEGLYELKRILDRYNVDYKEVSP